MLRGKKEVRLFPEIKRGRDGYGQTVSKWFNGNGSNSIGYRRRCGVEAKEGEPKKDFHSFRHTVITSLGNNREVFDVALKQMVGHSPGTAETDKRYKKRAVVEMILKQAVEHLDFHETVGLSHLKKSRFVVKD